MRTVEPEDFDVALELMAQLGWHKRAALGPGGSVCAARALNLAAKRRSGDWCDLEGARKAMPLPGKYPMAGTAIPRWNDAESTQWRDVELVFRAAAAQLRGFGAQDAGDDT